MFVQVYHLLFILIYFIDPTSSQICGQASADDLTYLYSYAVNGTGTTIYTPSVVPDNSSLTCKETIKGAVLKNETLLCNRLCLTKLTPLIKKDNHSTTYNYTSDAFIPTGFKINQNIQPVFCAKRPLLCGATENLYWNKNTGELSLANDYDPADPPVCFLWAETSTQYQQMSQTKNAECLSTPAQSKKLRRKKRNISFDFWQRSQNHSSEEDNWKNNNWTRDTGFEKGNNSASKKPCTSNSTNFNWLPWAWTSSPKARRTNSSEEEIIDTTITTRTTVSIQELSRSRLTTTIQPITTRLGPSTRVTTITTSQNRSSWPTAAPNDFTRRRIRDLSGELNDPNSSSSSSTTVTSTTTTLRSSSSSIRTTSVTTTRPATSSATSITSSSTTVMPTSERRSKFISIIIERSKFISIIIERSKFISIINKRLKFITITDKYSFGSQFSFITDFFGDINTHTFKFFSIK